MNKKDTDTDMIAIIVLLCVLDCVAICELINSTVR